MLLPTLVQKKLDVATFSIKETEIADCDSSILFSTQKNWPPDPVKLNEAVLFAGFPGNQRIEEHDKLECNFGLYSALTPVSSVSDRHFACAFDQSEWIDTMGLGLPGEGFDLGGISGCPVLALKESPTGIVSWHLAGIGYNATNTLGEIFLAHHAHAIRQNGILTEL